MAARQVGRTARFSSRSRPARAISSSWVPATIMCSGRSAKDMVLQGKPGGRRYYAHAFIACDPKPAEREPGRQRYASPGHDREWPGRRAGRSADPGCLDDQPRVPLSLDVSLALVARSFTTAA